MLGRCFAGILCCIVATASVAEDAVMLSLETADASRGWEGVGRLDIVGKGFCTGALVDVDQVLTAAHCLYRDDGQLVEISQIQFLAGLRGGQARAYRGVKRAVTHPDYVHRSGSNVGREVSHDLALLELDQPIRNSRIRPFETDARPGRGDEVGVVSYGKDRADNPTLQETCEVLGVRLGVLVMTCSVDFGSSGSPVFSVKNGVARIVSVVSSMAELDERKVSLGTSLARPLAELKAEFATVAPARVGGDQRFIEAGDRADTGAKFLRP
ncbi:trypsin-like serine peptidase [Aestuariibius insulae]|uniref:trypsin-like serine peptidase n=1 Tax=Aestuariibius insulae TaxID=2058287 RepID=UPI00398EAF76